METTASTAVLPGDVDDGPGGEEGAQPGVARGHQRQAGVDDVALRGGGGDEEHTHQENTAQVSRHHPGDKHCTTTNQSSPLSFVEVHEALL